MAAFAVEVPPPPPGFKLDGTPPPPPGFVLDGAAPDSTPPISGANTPPPVEGSPGATKKRGLIERGIDAYLGLQEIPLTMGSSMLAAGAGNVAGAAKAITGGKFGTPEGIQEGSKLGESVTEALTYRPRTEFAQEALPVIGKAFDESKLAGLNPAMALPAIPGLPAAGAAVKSAAGKVGEAVENLKPSAAAPAMAGVGAAETEAAALRRARAADLPVPIKLTKGQAERTFEQQQFERETAKAPKEGAPLRERYAEQNAALLQNIDAFLDQTGAETRTLRATGVVVDKALVKEAARDKAAYDAAYDAARKSGRMQEPVAIQPLLEYIEAKRPEAINAPVLSSVEAKIKQLTKDTQGISNVNDLEEVRKMVNALSNDPTNAHFGNEVKQVIDGLTDGKGGAEYARARALRTQFANKYENVGVIDRLLSKKPGTNDRAVAFEDVFAHSIMKGSLDDVRAIRSTLQKAGPEGQQAWKELQGQTIQHIKDEVTKGVTTDINGNRVVSAANLDRLVLELDRDGKLDVLFGKNGAQKIRDVNDLAKDVFTAPPGSVNTSNTASILIGLLDTAVSGVSGLPLPIGSAVNYGVKEVKSRALQKKVGKALAEPFPVVP